MYNFILTGLKKLKLILNGFLDINSDIFISFNYFKFKLLMGNVQQIIDFCNKLFALFILFFPFNLECIIMNKFTYFL